MSNEPELLTRIIEKEKFVLSATLIREGECVPKVAAILDADDFYRPKHRITYRTILKIYDAGKPVHILNLIEELQKAKLLDDVGAEFAYMLTEYANTNAIVEDYCTDIKNAANLRRVKDAAEKIISDAEKGIKPIADILDEFTNASAPLANPAEQFKVATINDCFDPTNSIFLKELKKMSEVKRVSSGFENFDNAQILLPGLYLIGAEPAIGKTDFVWQMLEQMARGGCRCIYASYEMDRNTMLRRIAARQIFKENPFTPLTSSNLHENVKYPEHVEALVSAMATLYEQNLDLRALELYGQNVDSLIRLLKPLRTDDKPFIIAVDYLQNLAAVTNPDNPKVAVDECLRKLKSFQIDTGALLFLVSSFNRAGYRIPVSYASFKESGSCEYYADAMFGLQLYAVNQITGKEKSAVEVSELIDNAFKEQPRHIQLRCVKNRTGNVYDLYFKYYSAHNYFVPCDEQDFIVDEKKKPSGGNEQPKADDTYDFEEDDNFRE